MTQGFANISEYAACDERGQTWMTQFDKKWGATSVLSGRFGDLLYATGTPTANFYATTPLEAATIPTNKGIRVPSVSPAKQYLKNITVMAGPQVLQSQTSMGRQRLTLCDYLLYYPFIDMSAPEEQVMTNTVPIPRYGSGRVMVFNHSPPSSTAQFIVNYTNQDGVSGRVTPVNYTFSGAAAGAATSLLQGQSGGLYGMPYLELQVGDTGVKSIESVTFTVPTGGLMYFLIVQPIFTYWYSEECRYNSGVSYGAASSFENILMGTSAPEIKDGAVLGLISNALDGNGLNSGYINGYIETIWN